VAKHLHTCARPWVPSPALQNNNKFLKRNESNKPVGRVKGEELH
jgi:hypothetical protein